MNRKITAPLAGVAIALATAACGGAYATHSSSAPAANTTPSPAAHVTTGIRDSSLGRIVVDGQGRTLYLFAKDQGTMSSCYGACAAAWPPVLTSGAPTAGPGMAASLVGVTQRSDGTEQVTYAGHPLYRYVADTKPGQTSGQGSDDYGAAWYALSPSGSQVASAAKSASAGW